MPLSDLTKPVNSKTYHSYVGTVFRRDDYRLKDAPGWQYVNWLGSSSDMDSKLYPYDYIAHLSDFKKCSEKDISHVEMRYARAVAREFLIKSRALGYGNKVEPSAVQLATARAAESYANHRAWIDPPLGIRMEGLDMDQFRVWVAELYAMGAGKKPERVTLSLGDIAGAVKGSTVFQAAIESVGDYEYQDGSRSIKVLKVGNEHAVLTEIVEKIEEIMPTFFNYVAPITRAIEWRDWVDYGNDPLEVMPTKKTRKSKGKGRIRDRRGQAVWKKDNRKGRRSYKGSGKNRAKLLGKGKVDKEWVIARYRKIRGRRSGVRVRMREGCRPKRPSPRFF